MDLPDLTGVGYLLIGCYIGLILFGVTVVQTWIYFLRFLADDPCMLKLMVILVVLADTANAVCQCIANYQYLVQRHDPARMLPAFLGALETSTLTAMLTQLFFAWRVHRLCQLWCLTLTIVFLSVAGTVGATVAVARYVELGYFDDMVVMQTPMLIWSSCYVACDIITSLALVITLRKSFTGFADTDQRLIRIKNLCLQTSSLYTATDAIHLGIVAVNPNFMLHLLFNTFVARLYTNSLLSTLNTRDGSTSIIAVHASASSEPAGPMRFSTMTENLLPLSGANPPVSLEASQHDRT